LAELPDLVGFFSYSRRDDEDSQGALSRLRARIQSELRLQLGRDFRLWQDTAAIPEGALWEDEIKRAITESVFFIPIVTLSAVGSKHCRFEFEAFLKREAELGRSNLIFPLVYVRVPALEKEEQWRQDAVLKVIGSRQYIDWQKLRHRSTTDPEVAEKVEQYCRNIVESLRRPWLTPEERRSAEKAAAQQLSKAGRRTEETKRPPQTEAKARQKDEEGRRKKVAAGAGPFANTALGAENGSWRQEAEADAREAGEGRRAAEPRFDAAGGLGGLTQAATKWISTRLVLVAILSGAGLLSAGTLYHFVFNRSPISEAAKPAPAPAANAAASAPSKPAADLPKPTPKITTQTSAPIEVGGVGDPNATGFGAIAFSPSQRTWGDSYGYNTRDGASRRALKECTDQNLKDCQVAVAFYRECGAVASDDSGVWGAGTGSTAQLAAQDATMACKGNKGQDCEIDRVTCTH
jgi:hypothetical protein